MPCWDSGSNGDKSVGFILFIWNKTHVCTFREILNHGETESFATLTKLSVANYGKSVFLPQLGNVTQLKSV